MDDNAYCSDGSWNNNGAYSHRPCLAEYVGQYMMTLPERLFWVGMGMGMVIAASCMLAPWIAIGEMQRQREVERQPSNVVRFRGRG